MNTKDTQFGDGSPVKPRHKAAWGSILGASPYRAVSAKFELLDTSVTQESRAAERLSPGAAENLKIRSVLMQELGAHITTAGMTEREAAQRLRVTTPRISELLRGRIDLFSIDDLVNMLAAAGLHVDLQVRKAT